MAFTELIYNPANEYLLKHISEIGFVFVSLVYIFFWKYVFIFMERVFRGFTFSLFENTPAIMSLLGTIDSFVIFVLTVLLVIPLIKVGLQKYINPLLNTEYLFVIVVVFFIISYLYYYFVYSRHYLNRKR